MNINPLASMMFTAALLGLSGCYSTQAQQSVEALIDLPSPSNRAILEQSIGDFFNSQPVKLADNVFTDSSTVIIERGQYSESNPNNSRTLGEVDAFTLLLQKNQCVLRHEQSKRLLALPTISCKPNPH